MEDPGPIVSRRPPVGMPPGITVEVTPAKAAANRVAGWKSGRYATRVTMIEGALARFNSKMGDGASEIFEAMADHVLGGEAEGTDILAAVALTETEIVRRTAAKDLVDNGVTLTEDLVNSRGEAAGSRIVANPAAKILLDASAQLGFTAQDRLLTPKSRREEADEAVKRALDRDQLLRSAPKSRMPAPIDASVVDEKAEPAE